MTFRVEIAARATHDLERLYEYINASDAQQAREWFDGLEALILSLSQNPARGAFAPENKRMRQVLYGKRRIYRVIYAIDVAQSLVTVLHIRHGAQAPLN
jgi:plasmid stabilization system protein ParE